jgi:hypothetical protein
MGTFNGQDCIFDKRRSFFAGGERATAEEIDRTSKAVDEIPQH